ncbi:unnamed protein product, partial [marine sediment metagenome]
EIIPSTEGHSLKKRKSYLVFQEWKKTSQFYILDPGCSMLVKEERLKTKGEGGVETSI